MEFLDYIKVIILGIVEGITEWLPISSTGHMILVESWLNAENTMRPEFIEMFRVVIQLGAILAVVVLYWKKIFPFRIQKGEPITIKKRTMNLWFKILLACIPAMVIGIPFDDKIDAIFFNELTVAITLIGYGVLFIILENYNKNKEPQITKLAQIDYKTAGIIGVFQVLALIPGTSRSGATIVGGMLIGVSRTVVSEFTFFLAIPVMFGASLLKVLKLGFDFQSGELALLVVGMGVAFIVSVFAIKFLMGYIKKHDFKAFGWYRIALGIIVLLYYFFK